MPKALHQHVHALPAVEAARVANVTKGRVESRARESFVAGNRAEPFKVGAHPGHEDAAGVEALLRQDILQVARRGPDPVRAARGQELVPARQRVDPCRVAGHLQVGARPGVVLADHDGVAREPPGRRAGQRRAGPEADVDRVRLLAPDGANEDAEMRRRPQELPGIPLGEAGRGIDLREGGGVARPVAPGGDHPDHLVAFRRKGPGQGAEMDASRAGRFPVEQACH